MFDVLHSNQNNNNTANESDNVQAAKSQIIQTDRKWYEYSDLSRTLVGFLNVYRSEQWIENWENCSVFRFVFFLLRWCICMNSMEPFPFHRQTRSFFLSFLFTVKKKNRFKIPICYWYKPCNKLRDHFGYFVSVFLFFEHRPPMIMS